MTFLKNTNLNSKLIIMLVLQLIGALYFSLSTVADRYKLSKEMTYLKTLSNLSVRISALVHETQKERGATAGYLGSNGTEFGT